MSKILLLINPETPFCLSHLRIRFVCCLLVFIFFQLPGIEAAGNPNRPVRLAAPSEYEEELSKLTEKIYRNLDYFFGPHPEQLSPRLHIRLRPGTAPELDPDADNPFHLILYTNQSRQRQAFAIARRAIFQRTGSISHEHSSIRFITPDTTWLAAAVTYAALQASPGRKINPRPDYGSLDNLFQRGRFPDLKTLIANPVTPDHPFFFHLYSMHCHLLLNLIRGPASGIWRSTAPPTPPSALLLESARNGVPPVIALRQMIKQIDEAHESFQEWYQMNAPDLARRSLRRLNTDRVLEELFLILTIDPEAEKLPSAARALKSENMEEMFQEKEPKLEDQEKSSSGRQPLLEFDDQEFWQNHRRFAAERYRRLMWMYPRTPMPLKDSVNKYLQAMHILARNGHTQRFTELVQEGDRLMKQALPEQRRFEEVIQRARQKHHGRQFSLEHRLLIPFIDKENRKQDTAPELSEFLN